MWLNRLFRKEKNRGEPEVQEAQPGAKPEKPGAEINQGIYYLYMIIGLQVLFVFGMLGAIMFIGKVISTPGWVFILMFLAFGASLVYIYRKAKRQLAKFRESFGKSSLADKNYEISFMGGMLTMRIEQNPNSPKLLQAPAAEPIIDAETIEPPADRKTAHLS